MNLADRWGWQVKGRGLLPPSCGLWPLYFLECVMRQNLLALIVFVVVLAVMGWAQSDDFETERLARGYHLVYVE